MTNVEKANKVAKDYLLGHDRGTITYEEMLGACLDMAEWKDEQLNEELNLIADWFNHIAQMADDKKTLTGFVMRDSDAFNEIKCLAKRCSEYVNKRLLNV